MSFRVFITPTPWARAVRAVGREGSTGIALSATVVCAGLGPRLNNAASLRVGVGLDDEEGGRARIEDGGTERRRWMVVERYPTLQASASRRPHNSKLHISISLSISNSVDASLPHLAHHPGHCRSRLLWFPRCFLSKQPSISVSCQLSCPGHIEYSAVPLEVSGYGLVLQITSCTSVPDELHLMLLYTDSTGIVTHSCLTPDLSL